MRRTVQTLVLLACCGCQGGRPTAQVGGVPGSPAGGAAGPPSALLDRVWVRSDSTGLPGVMRIFLENGTLVMDSCWETYQLARWHPESDSVVAWQEGAADIQAKILRLDAEQLVLRVRLANEGQDEHYRAASTPYMCPDMQR